MSKYSDKLEKAAKKASNEAIKISFSNNIPIVSQKGDGIYRIFPDGKKELLKTIKSSNITLAKTRISLNKK